MIDADTQSRFWNKVQKTETCWNWIGGGRGSGYGSFKLETKVVDTHRVSWMIAFGAIPDNTCVLHTCDNRRCVNPTHLFLGSKKDNAQDMWSKKRGKLPFLAGRRYASVRHGTIDEYRTQGCRCDACKAAQSAAMREYRERKRRGQTLASVKQS